MFLAHLMLSCIYRFFLMVPWETIDGGFTVYMHLLEMVTFHKLVLPVMAISIQHNKMEFSHK
jgi:hypothetical protein